jgi:hypothetical protein
MYPTLHSPVFPVTERRACRQLGLVSNPAMGSGRNAARPGAAEHHGIARLDDAIDYRPLPEASAPAT